MKLSEAEIFQAKIIKTVLRITDWRIMNKDKNTQIGFGFPEYALVFKVLSDETRLKIVDMLSGGELCACKILESFNITQPTLSYHMKALTESGLVSSRKDGKWMHYKLITERVSEIELFFEKVITQIESGDNANGVC